MNEERVIPSSGQTLRHASDQSLNQLMERMNRRVLLHVFSSSIQPDLLFKEILQCTKAYDGLMYSLIEQEICSRFNQIANIEEGEYLRSLILNNLTVLLDYLDSDMYFKEFRNASQKEKVQLKKAEEESETLWSVIIKLLGTDLQPQDSSEEEQELEEETQESKPLEWIKYEKKIDDLNHELIEEVIDHSEKSETLSPPKLKQSDAKEDKKEEAEIDEKPNRQNIRVVTYAHGEMMKIIAVLSLAVILIGSVFALSNILSVEYTSILRLISFASIWAFCVVNIVFIFVYYSSKILEIDIRDNPYEEGTFMQEYPVIVWSDAILLTVIVFSLWFYSFAPVIHITWLSNLFSSIPSFFLIAGTIILVYCFYRLFVWLKVQTSQTQQSYRPAEKELSYVVNYLNKQKESGKSHWQKFRQKQQERKERRQKEDELMDLEDYFDEDQ